MNRIGHRVPRNCHIASSLWSTVCDGFTRQASVCTFACDGCTRRRVKQQKNGGRQAEKKDELLFFNTLSEYDQKSYENADKQHNNYVNGLV